MSRSAQNLCTGIPLGPDIKVLADHPIGLLALEKPAGVRSHPNRAGSDPRSLLTCPYDAGSEFYRWENEGEAQKLHLLNRLDAPTSGVLLCATDEKVAVAVKKLFASREVRKQYLAVVKGNAGQAHGVWRDRLAIERRGGRVRTEAGAGQTAVTRAKRLKTASGRIPCALVELTPETGRSHQLRVQCADRKMPVVGDGTYGDFRFNREVRKLTGEKRLFLHAASVAVEFRHEGKAVKFAAESPLPKAFNLLLNFGQGL